MPRLLRSIIISFATAGLFVPFFFASAHQPRYIPATPATIQIEHPNVSQAFYGELRGAPDAYSIVTDKPLHLYASLLIPDAPHANKDIFVITTDTHEKSVVFTLNGETSSWKRFYEPFGGDWYLQGPEAELDVPAGTYHITVSSDNGTRKYVLAIGKTETFPFREVISAFFTLLRIKLFYFNESILQVLLSPWGVSFFFVLSVIAFLTFLSVRLSQRYSLRKRITSFCSMVYYTYIRKVG